MAIRFFALAFIWIMTSAAQAATLNASDVAQTDPATGCSFRLEGQIVAGDADRFATALRETIAKTENYPSPRIDRQIVLCLASPGGSFTEAIKIATLVYDNAVTTRINPGAVCLSACAIAFMGGNLDTRSGEGWHPSRFIHPTSVLGFHAPSLVLPEGQFTRKDVERAYGVAIAAVGLISREAAKLRIPQELLTEMFNNVGASFHYADRVDHLSGYAIKLYGYDVPPVGAEVSKVVCRNAWRWFAGLWKRPDAGSNIADWTAGFRTLADGSVEFYPFDGPMYCRHGVRSAIGGGDVDTVIQAEFPNFRDPRFQRSYMPWIRFPGRMKLSDVPIGDRRDF